jgi:zona occludens toxin (predicted ATPase)
MVEGFTGLPGSGKTYYAVKRAIEADQKDVEIWSNFKIDLPNNSVNRFRDLKEVFNVRKGLIIIDEINLVCPSRFWNKFPPELAYFWSQTRKFELDIIWTAQHVDRVDKIIKEISNYCWVFKKLPFGFHIANKFLPEHINKEKREIYERNFFRIDKNIANCYNTYEIIELTENLRTKA